ncbi:hypothetical protein AF72_04270 [Xylella taiwanensis]|uniref:Uncharacterized protein n=1 Tax=Xylella taiwanensis TaxID=1444770 RepID=Z9JLB7_9GAMM|nr:hypothetical protein AF72_04270 [Xylella taiwanensis]
MSHPPWDHLDAFLDTGDFAVMVRLSSETSGQVHECHIIF